MQGTRDEAIVWLRAFGVGVDIVSEFRATWLAVGLCAYSMLHEHIPATMRTIAGLSGWLVLIAIGVFAWAVIKAYRLLAQDKQHAFVNGNLAASGKIIPNAEPTITQDSR